MLSVDRNIPIFIHICNKMGLKEPFLNRDEYGNAAPIWEDCDEYHCVEDITWFKFVEDDEGNERVNVSFRDCYTFAFRSDDVQFFKEWLTTQPMR